MEDRVSLREWVRMYDNGDFDKKNVDTMIDAGWWDWFCTDSSLYPRLKRMVGMVKAAANSKAINPDWFYVFFKNNSPLDGPTYDSFSICSMIDGDVFYWGTAKYGHEPKEALLVKAPHFGDEFNVLPGDFLRDAHDIKRHFREAPTPKKFKKPRSKRDHLRLRKLYR